MSRREREREAGGVRRVPGGTDQGGGRQPRPIRPRHLLQENHVRPGSKESGGAGSLRGLPGEVRELQHQVHEA